MTQNSPLRAAILTVSDAGSRGERVDTSGAAIREMLATIGADVVHRIAPGIAEAMRAEGMRQTPKAMLSRAVAVMRGATLIINLPGSEKAVRECLGAVLDV